MKGLLLGILLMACGIAIIYYHNQLYKMFGDIGRAEKALGDSRVIYPLVGAGLIVLGILFMFGMGASDPTTINTGFGE